ncbi:MAG: hypothetical protein HYS08_04375 [Chlamydiae bacterium]|nr:hypothetical protein [Chlamydiota bacterium]MBI3265873.1 hypothetical protein [Chlamydiota bacterium]
MDISQIIPLISSLFVVSLGTFVLARNPKSKLHLLFMFFCLCLGIWLFGTYKMFTSKTDLEAISWDRFIYVGGILLPISMYHFSIVFGRIKTQDKILYGGYLSAFAFLLLSRTDFFVKDLYRYRWGCHALAQPLHHVFLIWFWSYVFLLNRNIYRFYKTTRSAVERNQAKYIFLAFTVLFGVGACAFLPAYRIPVPPFPFFAGGLLSLILGYAIARYRLMDIHFVIRNMIVNILLMGFVGGLIWMISWLKLNSSIRLTLEMISVSLAILYVPKLKLRTEEAVNHFLYKEKYHYQKELEKFVGVLPFIPKEEDLFKEVMRVLSETIQSKKAALWVFNASMNCFMTCSQHGFQDSKFKMSCDNSLVVWLKTKREIFVKEEMEKALPQEGAKSIIGTLNALELNVCVPVMFNEDLVAILLLGEKSSGEMYSHLDLEILQSLGTQLAIALDYKRVERELKKQEFASLEAEALQQKNLELEQVLKDLKTARDQKLTYVTQMAASLAHEIRNPLQPIRTYVEVLPERASDPHFPEEMAKAVHPFLDRMEGLVNQLMHLGKISKPVLVPVDPQRLIQETLKLWEPKLKGRRVDVTKDFQQSEVLIQADKDQLSQVFFNLIKNAQEAMPQGGELFIQAKPVKKSDEEFYRILFRDSGVGMDEETQRHLFEPFYTTKKDKGTGLGLAISRQMVEAHGGKIEIDSVQGHGTTVVIDLPACCKEGKDVFLTDSDFA